jgi:transposase-like protein
VAKVFDADTLSRTAGERPRNRSVKSPTFKYRATSCSSRGAIDQSGKPETNIIDKSGSNLAALEALNAERDTPVKIRQNKYLNNILEQDHRTIKRRTRPMLGFKTFGVLASC